MTTLKTDVVLTGVGIHSGKPVTVTVRPSDKKGIVWKRVDMPNSELIPALYDNVGETKMRNTTIGKMDSAHVQTVEHLMAALFISGIDSAIVEIDSVETPILDGSAAQFIDAFMAAGVDGGKFKRIVVKKPVVVRASEVLKQLPLVARMKIWLMNKLAGRKSDGFVSLLPNENNALEIKATLVYPEKIIGTQSYTYVYDGTKKSVKDFVENVARARTFGKYSEWEYLKKHGMGHGANESNVIALNDAGDGTLNKTYWPDEFVRHKIVDAIGDMFTSGGFVVAKMESYKGSHALNNLVLKKLFSNPDNYDIIDAE